MALSTERIGGAPETKATACTKKTSRQNPAVRTIEVQHQPGKYSRYPWAPDLTSDQCKYLSPIFTKALGIKRRFLHSSTSALDGAFLRHGSSRDVSLLVASISTQRPVPSELRPTPLHTQHGGRRTANGSIGRRFREPSCPEPCSEHGACVLWCPGRTGRGTAEANTPG